MDYRTVTCSFCHEPSVGPCARCTEQACAEHGGKPWCRACAEERADDLEFAAAEAALHGHVVIEDSRGHVSGLTLFTMMANAAVRPFRIRRAKKQAQFLFETRPPTEVLAAREARRRASGRG